MLEVEIGVVALLMHEVQGRRWATKSKIYALPIFTACLLGATRATIRSVELNLK